MKKFLIGICLVVFISNLNVQAAYKCTYEKNIEICTDIAKGFKYEKKTIFYDNKRKVRKEYRYTKRDKDNKLVYYENYYYNNKGKITSSTKENLIGTKKKTVSTYNNGIIKQIIINENQSKYLYKSIKKYSSKGIFENETIEYKYKKINKIRQLEKVSAHSNGKRKSSIMNRYTEKGKMYYVVSKKYKTNGYITSFSSTHTYNNKIVETRSYTSKGKLKGKVIKTYNKKNVLEKSETISTYSNGRNMQVASRLYNQNKTSKTLTTIKYTNSTKPKIMAKNILYYNKNGKQYKRVYSYYHSSQYYYTGKKDVNYKTGTGTILSAIRNNYYKGTSRIKSKLDYQYQNGVHVNTKTNYYDYYGTRTSYNEKRYNKGKLTYNITNTYSSKKIKYQKGYIYNTSTYQYKHNEYSNGVIVLNDVTTYKNNTIVKTAYSRNYYKNGKVDKTDVYTYKNGEVTQHKVIEKGKTTTKSVAKSYPVQKGVITSPSWFYPSSFGGGWHPGIDVATYKVATYGYAQPIKVYENATLLKRINSCHSTNSYGCGEGFGNYSLFALEKNGKFYTILYGHQSKLSTSNKTHKAILNKKTYKKNEVIGYVGSSGYSTGYHIHIQVQEHKYAKSIADIQSKFKSYNNSIFNVNYNDLSNFKDIVTVNPDEFFNLKYYKSW